MSEQRKKKKYTKIGAVVKGQYGEFITLGNEKATNVQYQTSVLIRVVDAQGNVIEQVKNGKLTMIDPRNNKNITDEQRARIPDSIIQELYIVTDEK